MSNFWDATTYSQFLDLRTRPALDLLSGLPTTFQPQTIYDLGCGPGNSTILLKERWPQAKIVGLDSAASMLEQARATYPDIKFIESDIAHFTAPEKIDLIFANASLQWLEQHEELFPHLIAFLNAGGAFAVQMPNNFHAPSHQVTIQLLKECSAWQPLLKYLRYGRLTQPFYHFPTYYDLLTHCGLTGLQLWETEYFQEMADHAAIFDWVKGTGLRPVLTEMMPDQQIEFKRAYIDQLKQYYPLQEDGKVLLPFRRLFMVGFNIILPLN